MTLKQRIFLVSAICIIFGGLLVSYKSFELNNKFKIQSENEKGVEISQWVAQSIEQKITHLESSVSYLDASTIETLKRMGARYFAYAYPSGDQWKIKWKVLGEFGRKDIINEVNKISFKEMSADRRAWEFNDKGEHILVSPVELANSHQLKNGFLIFGLNDSFFSFIGSADSEISLLSAGEKTLFSKSKTKITPFLEKIKSTTEAILLTEDGEKKMLSSFFSKPTQMWVTRTQEIKTASYLSSSLFLYFCLALILSLGFMALLLQRFIMATGETVVRRSRSLPRLDSLKGAGERFGRLSESVGARFKKAEVHQEDRPTVEKDLNEEVISEFASFLDDVVSLERSRLKQMNISVKTQVEEGASVLCSPQHVTDFLRRLISNSIKVLKDEDEKRIQIELVRLGSDYQLIYVDTRRQQYPSGEEPSLFLQDESSLENIDGLVSYGTWLFGESLTVAKEGFCLSVDLKKSMGKTASIDSPFSEALQAVDADRIEIRDEDTIDLEFEKLDTTAPIKPTLQEEDDEFSSKSIDDIVNSFEMKSFSFDDVEEKDQDDAVEKDTEKQIEDNGFFEFDTGDFKIKIRSPKTKRDTDVSS